MSLKRNSFFFILIAVILGITCNVISNRGSTAAFLPISLLFLLLLYNILKKQFQFSILLLAIFIVLQLFTFYKIPDKQRKDNFHLEVSKVATNYIIAKDNKEKYLIYDITDCQIGDTLDVKGYLTDISDISYPNLFSFKDYLFYQKVYYQLKVLEYQLIPKNTLRNKLMQTLFIDIPTKEASLIKALLFSQNDDYYYLKDNLKDFSLVHLLSISGLQINLLFLAITSLLKGVIEKTKGQAIAISIIFFYLYLLNFAISILRAFCQLVLGLFCRVFKIKLNRIDQLSLIALCFILINPLVIFGLDFIYSFSVTFILILTSSLYKKQGKIRSAIMVSAICYYGLLPITMLNNYEISLLTPLLNVLMAPLILLAFATAWCAIFIDPFRRILIIIIQMIVQVLETLSFFNPKVIFGTPNIYFILLYFIILTFLILLYQKRLLRLFKKCLIPFYALITIQYLSPHFNVNERIYFLDVGQGDATLIVERFSNKTILFDTGGLSYLDLAASRLIPYFKSLGIRKIDYLIISHSDFDHDGASESLIKKFPVHKLITENNFEFLKIGTLTLRNLNANPSSLLEDNDRSIVLHFSLGNKSYLLTGDISNIIEEKIIANYPDIKTDVLHLAHHGSSTSSSELFLDILKPEYAIISVGKNNRYKHPSPIIIERLNNRHIKYYRTDIHGVIIFSSFNNHLSITTKFN